MKLTILPVLVALAVAGCGAGGDGDTADRPDEDKQLAFAKCMREGGINVSDPGSGDGPRRVRIEGRVSPQTIQRVTRECRDKTGGGPRELSPEERQEFRDKAVKFAQCMRRNGVNVPDPSADGGIVVMRRARGASVNPDSPAFRRAQEACEKLLPRPRGGDGPELSARP